MKDTAPEEYISLFLNFLVLLVLSVVAIKLLKQIDTKSDDTLSIANVVIVFWTGVILAFYTMETHKLRKESQRQTELQLRPFVLLDISHRTSDRSVISSLQVVNVGNGTAINVGMRHVTDGSTPPLFRFIQVPIISAGQRHRISFNQRVLITKAGIRETLVFRIEFKNVEGKGYWVTQTVSSTNVDIDFG